jgi:hypothetical protein
MGHSTITNTLVWQVSLKVNEFFYVFVAGYKLSTKLLSIKAVFYIIFLMNFPVPA